VKHESSRSAARQNTSENSKSEGYIQLGNCSFGLRGEKLKAWGIMCGTVRSWWAACTVRFAAVPSWLLEGML